MSIFIAGGSAFSWEDARTQVRGDLWKPGNAIPTAVVDRALHNALLELEGEGRWLWLENITDGLTFAGASDEIDLPATVQSISSLSYVQGNSREQLCAAPLDTVRALSLSSSGLPSMYARTDGVLFFDTICRAGLVLELTFTASTPEILEDAVDAPNATLARQRNAIIPLACSDIARSYLKNTEEADRQWATYDRRLAKLIEKESQQRSDEGTGGVIPDTGYAVAAYGYGG